MNIAAINGSPKAKESLSGLIIGQMERIYGASIPVYQAARLVQGETPPEALAKLLEADALFIVFPLYVDALPAPLVELLRRLEWAALIAQKRPRVYAVVNCGFYEASQTELALKMVRHFADRAGLPWGMGVGIGRGPMLDSMGSDWSKGLAAAVYKALHGLVDAARLGGSGLNVFTAPKFPRFLYKAAAHMGWRLMAGRNGVHGQLRARPHALTLKNG